MSAAHRRGARREGQLAAALGTTRTKNRPRFQKAPDMAPVQLPSGFVLQGESKSRKSIPKWLTDAVDQAGEYTPGAIPVVALYAFRSTEGLAVLRLRDLVRLLGLEPTSIERQVQP